MLLNYQQIKELCLKDNLIDKESYSENYVQGASYDLHLGQFLYISVNRNRKSAIKSLKKDEELEIPANSILMFQTKEKVKLPLNVAGKLSLRMGLVRKGLLMPSQTQADPGFHNFLFGMLYNLSNEPIKIRESEHIVSIEFYKLEADTQKPYIDQYNKTVFEQFVSERVTSSLDYLQFRLNESLSRLKRTKKLISYITYYLAAASIALTIIFGYLTVSPFNNLKDEDKEIKQYLIKMDNEVNKLENSVILLDSLKLNSEMKRQIDLIKTELHALRRKK